MLRASGKRITNINQSYNKGGSWNKRGRGRGQLLFFFSPFSTTLCPQEEKSGKGREYKVLFFGSDSVSLPTLQLLHSLFLLNVNNNNRTKNNIDNNNLSDSADNNNNAANNNIDNNNVNNRTNNKEKGKRIGREWIENNDALKELLSTTIENSYLVDDNNKEEVKGGCRISHLSVVCPPDSIHKAGLLFPLPSFI